MKVNQKNYHTIWLSDDNENVIIIDQRSLPHEFKTERLNTVADACVAIKDMHVRGAPLIGVTAAFGMYLAAQEAKVDSFASDMREYADKLKSTRPTAVNLAWAVDQQLSLVAEGQVNPEPFLALAIQLKTDSINRCYQIGEHGLKLIKDLHDAKSDVVNILTHCNAGWMACIDYGTATAPIYLAHDAGIPIHVWVDETRPRNQGARITAFELQEHGIAHTVITDNAGGHLMQHGQVDMVIVGTDRTTATGDVCNKIGTYLKALAARDNHVPFYVAAPSSSIDFTVRDGISEIPIEVRDDHEVKYIQGLYEGEIKKVLLTPQASPAANYAFDVTPARLVTALITEQGICQANEQSLKSLFSK